MWTKRKESLTVLGCLAYELAIFELYLVGKQELGRGVNVQKVQKWQHKERHRNLTEHRPVKDEQWFIVTRRV